ncbi:hypothetical protein Pint_14762 [Pistacia integerrima]|uniref:Uncharacterized protein n=1 Tax=Pistacia integerrima TaxID=434235 RepID=A0ACC0Y6C1_9ROSI|nr:hypothetical protein Pint_14762 [Pistacia integerrima]
MAEPSSAARACAMEAISTHRCTLSAVACGGYFVGGFELPNSVRNAEDIVADVDYVELQPEINFIVADIAALPIAFRQPVIMNDSHSFMHPSTEDLLSGCSAGDLAYMLHCDEFRDLFPNTTKVKCLSDGGMFLDA